MVEYTEGDISKGTIQVFYDYRIQQAKFKQLNDFVYDYNGRLLYKYIPTPEFTTVLANTMGMSMANYFFYKCYNMKFTDRKRA